MIEAKTWVDVESAVREWARDANTAALRRVFFEVNNDAAFPQVRVQRVAGPDLDCLVTLHCYGSHKAAAASLAAEVATAADALGRYEHGGVLLHGARVEQIRPVPDPEQPAKGRYVVDVTFTASAV